MTVELKAHWDNVYREKAEASLTWHQDRPTTSLDLIDVAGLTPAASVIDIGGGTSRLAAALLADGFTDVTVLDVSGVALDKARSQLGHAGKSVTWIATDITAWRPDRTYDLWHDRAVFHFLVSPDEQKLYLDNLKRALHVGGHAIIATFAPDGPEKCSGLPVVRYSPAALGAVMGSGFELIAHQDEMHQTPPGRLQAFQFSLFRRTD
jgi:trans-aconitate methyltransferase